MLFPKVFCSFFFPLSHIEILFLPFIGEISVCISFPSTQANIMLIIIHMFELFFDRKTEVKWRVQRQALAEQPGLEAGHIPDP